MMSSREWAAYAVKMFISSHRNLRLTASSTLRTSRPLSAHRWRLSGRRSSLRIFGIMCPGNIRAGWRFRVQVILSSGSFPFRECVFSLFAKCGFLFNFVGEFRRFVVLDNFVWSFLGVLRFRVGVICVALFVVEINSRVGF